MLGMDAWGKRGGELERCRGMFLEEMLDVFPLQQLAQLRQQKYKSYDDSGSNQS